MPQSNFRINKKFNLNGFTLIELLVVISIISILAVAGLAAYSAVLKSGRDSKRVADLSSVQSALESYFNDQKYYPGTVQFFGGMLTNATGTEAVPAVSKIYLNIVSTGAGTTADYYYQAYKNISPTQICNSSTPSNCAPCETNAASSCVMYCLFAKGENRTITAPGCTKDGYSMAFSSP